MTRIHQTAVVDKNARIGDDAEIGPYCVIGPNVVVGNGSRLMAHVYVEGWTTIGSRCILFPFCSIGTQCQDLKYDGSKTFVSVGDGTVLREYVTVNSSTEEGHTTSVGKNCLIMAYCHVAHECVIGDGVIMSNGVQPAGHVTVEDQAIVSGLTGIHQFVRIGRMAFVGGCSRIAQDVPPYMLVEGNPAVVHGPNSVGLRRRNVSAESRESLKEAFKIIYRENLSVPAALEQVKSDVKPCPEVEYLVKFIEASKRGIVR